MPNRQRFANPWPHDTHGVGDIIRWKLFGGHREPAALPGAPDRPAERVPLDPERISGPPAGAWRAVWLGHSSFLLQGAGCSLMVDPVFSRCCAPLPLPSLARHVDPPCALADLPRIDAVLLSHSHYDHCDLPTLRALGDDLRLHVPEGHRAWLRRRGFHHVTEHKWWETHELTNGVRVTAAPAQHFTARGPLDRNRGHWCGWIIEGAGKRLWHAGDSGWCPGFAMIGERCGPIDLGMIPIGAYQPRSIMRSMHMNPSEAVDAFLATGCRRAVAMHWGTFRLTDEPMGEPPLLLEIALRERGIPPEAFAVQPVGAVIEME